MCGRSSFKFYGRRRRIKFVRSIDVHVINVFADRSAVPGHSLNRVLANDDRSTINFSVHESMTDRLTNERVIDQ